MCKPLAVIFMIVGFLLGCQNSSKNSFIIIATDQLSFQDANCSRDWSDQNSGIGLLCRESVRWTHAYTTSVLSGPALSSILTGLHPLQTGYHHPGQYLEPKFMTVAQAALQQNYRTAFFSGGPPLLKKSGLDAGFELFDDSINLNENPYLKPFRSTISTFLDWMNEIGGSPFFVTFYVPDLRFVTRTTTTVTGEDRNKSFESQLEEFDSALFDLIANLKRRNRWDKTHVILVGLQGHNLYDRQGIYPNLNLHSENSQITMLWKPAQKKRDLPLTWKMDKDVSLADLGQTLFDLFGEKTIPSNPPTESLALTLSNPQPIARSERLHLIESAWGQWQLGTPIFSAILNDEELYFHSQPPVFYHTLSDRLEINPVFPRESNQSNFVFYKQAAEQLGLTTFIEPKPNPLSLWNLTYDDWLTPKYQAILDLYKAIKPQEISQDAHAWYARALIENGEWKRLKIVAEAWKNQNYLWLANQNLGLPKAKKSPPCLELVNNLAQSNTDVKNCHDPIFLETLRSLEGEKKSKKWEKILQDKLMMVEILKTNRALGTVWEVPETDENIISLSEMLFWAPEYKSHLKTPQKKIKNLGE
jgi:hypothetical protein